uniref:Ig-like domain-containing protein n=1 Tax=Cyprinus carpio TaxID=7962 RepID=A0A8C2E1N0_CYPCA
ETTRPLSLPSDWLLSFITLQTLGLQNCLNGQPKHPLSVIIKASRTARIQSGLKIGKNDPGIPARYAGSVKGSDTDYLSTGAQRCRIILLPMFNMFLLGEPVKLPKVSGYLPSKKYIDKQGKQTMLCQASDMFPDLVKFTWRTKSEAGDFKDVPEENVVEQSYKRDNKTVTVTSMMIIDKNTIEKNNYQCTVTHEGTTKNTEILEMKRGNLKKL